jgi:TIR domain
MPAKKSAVPRTDIFISYSHKDKAWLDRLRVHLKPLERTHHLNIWADTKLRSGDKWRAEIDKALAKTRVAILLVSPYFLASDFIDSNELPPLLAAAQREGTIILPVLLSSSAFLNTPLSEFQAVNIPEQVLDLLSEGQINQVLLQVYQRVYEIFTAPTKPARVVVAPAKSSIAPAKPSKSAAVAKPNAKTAAVASPPKAKSLKAPASAKAAQIGIAQAALLVKRSGEWAVFPVKQAKIGTRLEMVLSPANAGQIAFLTTLRQANHDPLASVVFRFQTYFCKLRDLDSITENNRENWHLHADLQTRHASTEITYNSITPDMQAQGRAELLLLNTQPHEQNQSRWFSGSGLLTDVAGSPFPALYKHVNGQAALFKQAAPLIATWFLHLTNTVQHILKLTLTPKGQNLTVSFEGQRDAASHNQLPTTIRVAGTCSLTSATDGQLLLGPLRNY